MEEAEKNLEQIENDLRLIRPFLLRFVMFGGGAPEPVLEAIQRIVRSIPHAPSPGTR